MPKGFRNKIYSPRPQLPPSHKVLEVNNMPRKVSVSEKQGDTLFLVELLTQNSNTKAIGHGALPLPKLVMPEQLQPTQA